MRGTGASYTSTARPRSVSSPAMRPPETRSETRRLPHRTRDMLRYAIQHSAGAQVSIHSEHADRIHENDADRDVDGVRRYPELRGRHRVTRRLERCSRLG